MARRPSGRSGRAVLSELRRELERGFRPGLTVLTGDDAYHLDAAQRALVAELVPADASEFALTVYGEQKVDTAAVAAAARTLGMFAPRRVVLVREIAALEGEPDALVEYARHPPPQSFLLVRAPSLDRRRKLHQALVQCGRVLEFAVGAVGDLTEAKALASEKGLALDDDAADLLSEVAAGDLYRLDGELEKIRSWLGAEGGKRVTSDVVREVGAGSGVLTGWEVANAVLRRDVPEALAGVRRLLDSGEEPLRLLGGLAWRARVMLQARALLDQGQPMHRVLQEVRAWGFDQLLREGLKHYSLRELLAFPRALHQADLTLKSRALDSRAVLERLVERLAQR